MYVGAQKWDKDNMKHNRNSLNNDNVYSKGCSVSCCPGIRFCDALKCYNV